jgi:hypothetical protein
MYVETGFESAIAIRFVGLSRQRGNRVSMAFRPHSTTNVYPFSLGMAMSTSRTSHALRARALLA